MASIALRPPTFSPATQPADFPLPSVAWLTATWHVTHSTLPMWKSKRNVRITYTPLPPSDPSIPKEQTDKIDDLVTYQSLSSDKISTIKGIDTAAVNATSRGEWDWRGKGWLKIASSHWEILGWGEEKDSQNKWMVTMFAKTLFTPAGIDVYSESGEGLQEATLGLIKDALAGLEDEDAKKMAETLFEIKSDKSRSD